MTRVINTVEKNVYSEKLQAVVVPAGQATDVLSTIRGKRGEYAGRYIQNVGNSDCYYAFDIDCDGNLQINGYLAPKQQLDVSNFPGRVNIYSAAGTTIALTVLRRDDLQNGVNIAQGNVNVP